MSKEKDLDKARKSKIFPQEYIDSYSEDLSYIIDEHEKEKRSELDDKLLIAFSEREMLIEKLRLSRL